MNLKYYLRGLGIGIAMTAIILGIGREKETLSDAEIKQRAAELGMVEQSGLLSELEVPHKTQMPQETEEAETTKDLQETEVMKVPKETEAPKVSEASKATPEPKEAEVPKETEAPKASEAPKETEAPKASEAPKETEAPKASETPKDTQVPEKADEPEEVSSEELKGTSVSIVVNPGDGSYTVCKRLEEAGLIASAVDFDKYMSEKGYDKKLQVGTFQISKGTEPEEIVMILMKRK